MEDATFIDTVRAIAQANQVSLHRAADLLVAAAKVEDGGGRTVVEHFERMQHVDGAKSGWVKRKGHYREFAEVWGDRPLDTIKPQDVEQIALARRQQVQDAEDARQAKLQKRGFDYAPRRSGRGAQRNTIEAARRFFQVAVGDGVIVRNPAAELDLPARETPGPRSLKPQQIEQLWAVVVSGGDDPELDGLLLWFHLETGARRGGAIGLRRSDLQRERGVIRLHEKGRDGLIERPQPVSVELIDALLAHSHERGAGGPSDAVFYYRDSTPARPHPLLKKRYETLYARIRRDIPWAQEVWTKTHDLRRTAITMIERISGSPAIARLYAGHRNAETLHTYDAADYDELQESLAIYLGRDVGGHTPDSD